MEGRVLKLAQPDLVLPGAFIVPSQHVHRVPREVIRSGEVEIERDGKIVEKLGPGGIFGEMALIDGAPRAATAKAKTACEVAPITEKTFLFLVHETPFFAISVMRALADRLRRATPA